MTEIALDELMDKIEEYEDRIQQLELDMNDQYVLIQELEDKINRLIHNTTPTIA